MRFSRFFLAGGQNAVPVSGWFLGGWSAGTTLTLFWFENLALSLFIGARIAVHWQATRTRGHTNGFLRTFLLTSLVFTLAHGLFLAIVLTRLPDAAIDRADLVTGIQWMLGVQVASLLVDLWRIGGWPFAEIRLRTDWLLGRVVMIHMSILVGMFLFMALDRPSWFFSTFLVLKAMTDIGGLLPRWDPKAPPAGLEQLLNKVPGKNASKETFGDYWRRVRQTEQATRARDEEVVPDA